MFKDNNTVSTGPICCEPVREAGIRQRQKKQKYIIPKTIKEGSSND